ncbi:Methionine aminopeptidase 1 [Porphyridium purpureum]|uniref:Methionine aminopeptidase n=1 Tax=Porphyridium purpureum TaxID=35688 RepID=A0A5J4YS56_PORPP|nr:Methionine aminopeptidase 1 [Porphyridium purpureum]|eukprot:POR3457..scf236_6
MTKRLCATPGCGKEAQLRCPTCIKLGKSAEEAATYFCDQECFRGYWKMHKEEHNSPAAPKVSAEDADKLRSELLRKYQWENFQYTGDLRVGKVSASRSVPAHIKRPDYARNGTSKLEENARRSAKLTQLSQAEIGRMRTVCRLAREVLDIGARMIRPGVTTDQIDAVVHDACIERNAYPSPLNYYHFPKSLCTSVNEVICHGIPDSRPLENGDIVNLDITLYFDGMHGDLNETYLVGDKASEESKLLVKSAYDALHAAIDHVKPGVLYREFGGVIEKMAQANGHNVVRTYCGHGINELFHCAPNVPHYKKNKAVGMCKPGHTFTIEPMLTLGTWRDVTWPDRWTAATADGKWSAQFEHTLLVTESGVDILTARLPDSPKHWWEEGYEPQL